jgi:NAD(P)-dependent dehydrogenase (short-subunit alcohol dehydrogenase family)
MTKVWFITGANRGFGLEFAQAALSRGDKVAGTSRDTAQLNELTAQYVDNFLPLQLDVTNRAKAFDAVTAAVDKFGRLDVVVNNAGYGLFGAVEEISEQQLRDQLEVNLFGVFHVTQAVLPILRAQGSGHIIQISTIGGIGAFPSLGGYHASKWALEGMTESMAQEVAGFGIKVTLVEPGGFATDWAGSSAVHAAPLDAYAPLRQAMSDRRKNTPAGMIGDPQAAGPAILDIADAAEPPLRVLFGTMPTQIVKHLYEQRLKIWKDWEHVSIKANG